MSMDGFPLAQDASLAYTPFDVATPPPSGGIIFLPSLTFDDYQANAQMTDLYGEAVAKLTDAQCRDALRLCLSALGLAGEAGEVAGKVKKFVRDDLGVMKPERRSAILKEVGGTLWYAADVATYLGASLGEDVARANLTILASRMERGVLKGDGDDR